MHFKGLFMSRNVNITLCGQRLKTWSWGKFDLSNICAVFILCLVSLVSTGPVTIDR